MQYILVFMFYFVLFLGFFSMFSFINKQLYIIKCARKYKEALRNAGIKCSIFEAHWRISNHMSEDPKKIEFTFTNVGEAEK